MHIIFKGNYGDKDIAATIKKSGLKGILSTVNIKNFFNTDGTFGNGLVEKIEFENDNYFDFSSFDKVNDIRQQIAGWLADGGKYKSAIDVIKSGTQDDISTLLTYYQGLNTQILNDNNQI